MAATRNLLTGVLLAALAAGCGSARDQAPPRRDVTSAASSTPPSAPPPAAAPAQSASAQAAPVEPTAAPSATPPAVEALAIRPEDAPYAHFFAALRELAQGKRKDHVRVAWLGDSHGASDFWSGALRTVLQKRFGNAGPGFVHLGHGAYRHDGIKIAVDGKWRMRPKGPATVLPTGDGIFGLGGIFFSVDSGPARAQLTVTDAAVTGRLRWDVCYRLAGAGDQISVALTGTPPRTLKATPEEPSGAIRHAVLGSEAGATLIVTPSAGAPELCGAMIDVDPTVKQGVVIDTLGINGARLATPLAWNEVSWTAELARRAPELVVLEYGTNESGDFTIDPSNYIKHLADVVARVRKVNPDVDCLALAPTDRKDTPERTPLVRDALRAAAKATGCGFWDSYETMGGKGTIEAWSKETPPRAAPDGVHLTSRGYRELGFKLADELLQRYQP